MKRRLLIGMALVVILTLVGMFLPAHQVAYAANEAGSVPVPQIAHVYSGAGSGTVGDPYIITTVNQLQEVEDFLSAYWELGGNIDASATSGWNYELYEPGYYAGFLPITSFTGHLDGKGYVVTDLYIGGDNATLKSKQQALFYQTLNATIQNLGLENITVIGDEKGGALVGKAEGGLISQCYATGSITIPSWGTKGKGLAGLVGNTKGSVSDCYARVDVTGLQASGGFVGKHEVVDPLLISNSYSTGSVNVGGGFTGEAKNVGSHCYEDSFWDTETSGQASDPNEAVGNLEGKTTAEMKDIDTFTTGGSTWDFTNVWDIDGVTNGGYPFLRVFVHEQPPQSPEVGTQIGAEYPITISPSSMTPQEEWTTVTVPVEDGNTLADVDEVIAKLFYDSAGSDPDQSGFSANVQTCAILTWTRGGSPWTIAPGSTTWAINSGGCSKPSDSGTQGNWVFSFKVGKVATNSPSTDDWDIYAKATDSASGTGEDYLRDKEMNWYGEITVNTASVDWGSLLLGSGFTDDTTNRVTASVTYICNGNFNKQIKATSPWGSSPTVTLNPSGTPGAGEFSLKADDDLTLSGAVLVSTSYATFGTGIQTDEDGVDETSNGIWLKMGPSGIQGGVSYDGTIYYAITQS